jgi:hypothetical protein
MSYSEYFGNIKGPNPDNLENEIKAAWKNYKPIIRLADRESMEKLGFSESTIQEQLRIQNENNSIRLSKKDKQVE